MISVSPRSPDRQLRQSNALKYLRYRDQRQRRNAGMVARLSIRSVTQRRSASYPPKQPEPSKTIPETVKPITCVHHSQTAGTGGADGRDGRVADEAMRTRRHPAVRVHILYGGASGAGVGERDGGGTTGHRKLDLKFWKICLAPAHTDDPYRPVTLGSPPSHEKDAVHLSASVRPWHPRRRARASRTSRRPRCICRRARARSLRA